MGIQRYHSDFPAPRDSFVEQDSGALEKDARYFLLAIYNRTGAGPGLPSVGTGLIVLAGTPFGIISDWSEFDTVPVGGVAVIPALSVGADAIIFNGDRANTLSIQPQPNAQIDALGLGVGYALAAGKMQWFRAWSPTQLRSMQLG